MLVRVALGRQIKERQGWVDQAEHRRFLVSFDIESGGCLTSVAAVPEIEPRPGTLEEVGATDEAGLRRRGSRRLPTVRCSTRDDYVLFVTR
jgi:hypothetical protein